MLTWLYNKLLGLRIATNEQHIADLKNLIADMRAERDQLNADIAAAEEHLAAAIARQPSPKGAPA